MINVGERGEGKFERITWDEALDTVAGEYKRIKETFDVFLLQKVLETLGAQDVQDIISLEDYESEPEEEPVPEEQEAELTESHIGEKVNAICPLCSFPESILYPDHAGLLVCTGCGKTWDPEIEGRLI